MAAEPVGLRPSSLCDAKGDRHVKEIKGILLSDGAFLLDINGIDTVERGLLFYHVVQCH